MGKSRCHNSHAGLVICTHPRIPEVWTGVTGLITPSKIDISWWFPLKQPPVEVPKRRIEEDPVGAQSFTFRPATLAWAGALDSTMLSKHRQCGFLTRRIPGKHGTVMPRNSPPRVRGGFAWDSVLTTGQTGGLNRGIPIIFGGP